MSKLINILQGWAYEFLDEFNMLSDEIKQISIERLEICNSCPIRTNNYCDRDKKGIREDGFIFRGCGCAISPKSKVPYNINLCPGFKWKK